MGMEIEGIRKFTSGLAHLSVKIAHEAAYLDGMKRQSSNGHVSLDITGPLSAAIFTKLFEEVKKGGSDSVAIFNESIDITERK